jgi:hypothetical protein
MRSRRTAAGSDFARRDHRLRRAPATAQTAQGAYRGARRGCRLERFETQTDDRGAIIVKAQFAENDLAELFRREFQGNYGD